MPAADAPSPSPRATLGVAMCTRDNERTLDEVLGSIAPVADRIVIVDSGSRDGTLDIARRYEATLLDREWDGPVAQKQYAIDQASDLDWVLLLDSDEVIEPELQRAIRRVLETATPAQDAFAINRRLRFRGHTLRHTFQPEWRTRLFRSGTGVVAGLGPNGRGGHDRVDVPGSVGQLPGYCLHDSWVDTADMLRRYVGLGRRAAEYAPSGGRVIDLIVRPPSAFLKHYVLKRGFMDGRDGLIVALGVFVGNLMKHMMIAETRRSGGDRT